MRNLLIALALLLATPAAAQFATYPPDDGVWLDRLDAMSRADRYQREQAEHDRAVEDRLRSLEGRPSVEQEETNLRLMGRLRVYAARCGAVLPDRVQQRLQDLIGKLTPYGTQRLNWFEALANNQLANEAYRRQYGHGGSDGNFCVAMKLTVEALGQGPSQ